MGKVTLLLTFEKIQMAQKHTISQGGRGGTFPVIQVKTPPAMQETQVRSLVRKDPLEEETATHSSILAWEIPWTEEPGRLQSIGSPRVRHD